MCIRSFCHNNSSFFCSYVDKEPASGETVLASDFSQGFGGKGANQCIMAARMGASCHMVGKVSANLFFLSVDFFRVVRCILHAIFAYFGQFKKLEMSSLQI